LACVVQPAFDRLNGEADLGHTLVERAVSRHHPMTLTSFGEELAQAARRIDGP
jgi:hypothetical protein